MHERSSFRSFSLYTPASEPLKAMTTDSNMANPTGTVILLSRSPIAATKFAATSAVAGCAELSIGVFFGGSYEL